jgi:hypothetical protein
MTTRDELEALIRKRLAAWHGHRQGEAYATTQQAVASENRFVDAILDAADSYATAQAAAALGAIDNYRRNHQPVIHFRDDFNVPSCRRTGMLDPVLTETPAHVTCGACVRTHNYHEAVA